MQKRLIAIGDIHGCYDTLKKLLEENIGIQKDDQIVLLGDYVDRGRQIKEVVDYIMELINSGYNIKPIMGNHEAMLLAAQTKKDHTLLWLQNGGDKTLESFDVESPKMIDQRYIEFFKNLDFYYIKDDFIFVHAGFNNKGENPFDDNYTMLWQCSNKYSHPDLKDKIIVHGHCTTTAKKCDKRIRGNKKVLGIDTGCVYDYPGYGRLTALELHTMEVFSQQREKPDYNMED